MIQHQPQQKLSILIPWNLIIYQHFSPMALSENVIEVEIISREYDDLGFLFFFFLNERKKQYSTSLIETVFITHSDF